MRDADAAERKVAGKQDELVALDAAQVPLVDAVARSQAALAAHAATIANERGVKEGFEREHSNLVDALIKQARLDVSAVAIRLDTEDPIGNEPTVIRYADWVRRATPSGFEVHTSVNLIDPPVVKRALRLLPERDELHIPISETGRHAPPWLARRPQLLVELREILTEIEGIETSPPLQAA